MAFQYLLSEHHILMHMDNMTATMKCHKLLAGKWVGSVYEVRHVVVTFIIIVLWFQDLRPEQANLSKITSSVHDMPTFELYDSRPNSNIHRLIMQQKVVLWRALWVQQNEQPTDKEKHTFLFTSDYPKTGNWTNLMIQQAIPRQQTVTQFVNQEFLHRCWYG